MVMVYLITTFPDEYLAAENFSDAAVVGASSSEKPWYKKIPYILYRMVFKGENHNT